MPPAGILQVVAHDVIGGTELKVAMLSERLRAEGLDVHVVLLDAPGPIAGRLRAAGVPVRSLGGRGGLAGAAGRLGRVMAPGRFGLVEAYGIKASFIARLAGAIRRPRPLHVCGVMGRHITEVVELDEPKGRLALAAERATNRLVDAYDVINMGALEMLAGAGIERERLHYIPNGIDLEQWPLRDPPGSGSEPLVVCTARFVPRKRQEDLLRALALLAGRGIELRAVLPGAGPTFDACRALVTELGLEARVELPGTLPPAEVRALMDRATAFCLPTLWEGMPAAVLEAMARGVPVVATRVDGVAELVEDGVSGMLVPPKQPEALAAALERVVADAGGARRLALAAREHVERDLSFDRLVERKHALYTGLLETGR